jgi:hypothetical protein
MAAITLKTLVLRGVHVVRDVVTGRTGMGFAAKVQAPLPILSHPSSRYQQPHRPDRQLCLNPDADNAEERAGRPERETGVPSRRSPAMSAGRAIPLGWALETGELAPTAVWRLQPFMAKRWTTRGRALTASTRGSDS